MKQKKGRGQNRFGLSQMFHFFLFEGFPKCKMSKYKINNISNYYRIQKSPSRVGVSTRIAGDNSGRYDQNCR